MKYLIANWKMYLDYSESVQLAKKIAEVETEIKNCNLVILPNYLALKDVKQILDGTKISVGSQNCAWVPRGAYTGATSAEMIKEIGVEYTLVGHSERRYIFGETDSVVRKKTEAALEAGLTPIVCIGETEEDKESGKTNYRLAKQIMSIFKDLNLNGKNILVAYEPVWAISSNINTAICLPADVEDRVGFINLELEKYTSSKINILYGGSVNEENVVSYLSLSCVDGVLVGSASIKKDILFSMLRATEML